MIDSSPRSDPWSATRIVQVTLGLWFGSIHQPAMVIHSSSQLCLNLTDHTPQAIVYALYDLCRHPEYIETLREEITQHSKENAAGEYYEHMPRLDSFLKESARFSPSDSSKSILTLTLKFNRCTHATRRDSQNTPICPRMLVSDSNLPSSQSLSAAKPSHHTCSPTACASTLAMWPASPCAPSWLTKTTTRAQQPSTATAL